MTWLHRLYVQIVLPAKRESMNMVREECPNTIAAFLSVCDFLVRVRGIPAHWIVSTIDDILKGSGRNFKSWVRPPSTFPNRYEPLEMAETINLSSFSLDLETQLALWMQKYGPGPLSTVKLASFQQDVRRYTLTGYFMENSYYGPGGNPNARCLGLVLEQKPPTTRSSPTSDLEEMMKRLMTGVIGSGGEAIRDDLLASGAPDYIVLSCLEYTNNWTDETMQKVTFLMSPKAFEKYSNYHVSLIRTDSYERIQSGSSRPFRLHNAKANV